jgi:hypothetical protein
MSADTPIALRLINNGNFGNKMFQYAYLRRLQNFLPASEIFDANIPELGVRTEKYKGSGDSLLIWKGHDLPFEVVARKILKSGHGCLRFGGYVQRMEYLGSVDDLGSLFSLPKALDDERFRILTSDRYITCIVRANEILKAVHLDYPPTPISFFRAAVLDSGRIPVLMGQTASSFYSDALRRMFPDCVVYDHVSPLEDFRFITHSTNVAIAVSTFAWMASYLSKSAKHLYLPVFGFYNRAQRKDIDLLPIGDVRYRFAEFETMKWTGADSQIAYVMNLDLPVSFHSK